MSKNHEVLITGVASGSPAEKTELQPGDVITAIDGKDQTEDTAMMDYINSLKVGQSIDITYYHGNTKNNVSVTLVQEPTSKLHLIKHMLIFFDTRRV